MKKFLLLLALLLVFPAIYADNDVDFSSSSNEGSAVYLHPTLPPDTEIDWIKYFINDPEDPRFQELPNDLFTSCIYRDDASLPDRCVTQDLANIQQAIENGGEILLTPGTYLAVAIKPTYPGMFPFPVPFHLTKAAGVNAPVDFELGGERSGKLGPAASINLVNFFGIFSSGGEDFDYYDPSTWVDADYPSHTIKNLAFNSETVVNEVVEALNEILQEHGWPLPPFDQSSFPTSFGHVGFAQLNFKNNVIYGGGATFQLVGSLDVVANHFVNSAYGLNMTSFPMYFEGFEFSYSESMADIRLHSNVIQSNSNGIQIHGNGHVPDWSVPKSIEVIDNQVAIGDCSAGIWLEKNYGSVNVKKNNVYINDVGACDPGSVGILFHDFELPGFPSSENNKQVADKNIITSSGELSSAIGIYLIGTDGVEIRSNRVVGKFEFPLIVSGREFPFLLPPMGTSKLATHNLLTKNRLEKSEPVENEFGFISHIFLDEFTSNNFVQNSGIESGETIVVDDGFENVIESK